MSKGRSKVYKKILWTNTITFMFLIVALDVYFIKRLVFKCKRVSVLY